jgi:hypothetical protein
MRPYLRMSSASKHWLIDSSPPAKAGAVCTQPLLNSLLHKGVPLGFMCTVELYYKMRFLPIAKTRGFRAYLLVNRQSTKINLLRV